MLNIKGHTAVALAALVLVFMAYAADSSSSNANSIGESPEWVTKLPESKTAKQLFVVAAYEGTPGKGSAIFLHVFGDRKPFTGGCVAIPLDKMRFVMQNVSKDCVVIINSLEKLGGSF